ncbi:L-idonate 5-dehydrogenase [Georgenia alba]|uniref:L-idonate 5-dehydrogenase n=1 Tax=Georgenia alba TaxID=2233858 RepID=A0ABW2QAN9_9MICO
MRALTVHGPGDVRVVDMPDPRPDDGEVLLAVEWGGLCGSDLSYWRHGASGTARLRRPMVLGHEVAGSVVATGRGVSGIPLGLRAAVHPATPSHEPLPPRLAGRTNLHAEVRYLGSAAFDPHTDGGFAELLRVRVDQLRPLPPEVTTRHGALAEPLGVALHAVRRAGGLNGREVLVNGCGPIGALIVAAARHEGAGRIIVCDLARGAVEVARRMGADEVRVLGEDDELPEDVEVTFEASGSPAALRGVLRATARGGTIVQVGNLPGTAAESVLGDLVTRELTWVGAYRFVDEITEAIDAMGAGLDVSPVITHEFDLDQAGEALAVAADRASGASKVMLRVRTTSPSEETTSHPGRDLPAKE